MTSLLKLKRLYHFTCCATIIFILLAMFSFNVEDKLTVKGKILDDSGKPVPFASVIIKDSRNSVMADVEGNFTIEVPVKTAILFISAPAYKNYERKLSEADFKGPSAEIIVTLKVKDAHLDEVVVTAAFSAKRSVRSTSTSFSTSGLEGRVAGVRVAEPHAYFKDAKISRDKKAGTAHSVVLPDSIAVANSRTKLLTAGEVNDFKKWKMWEDYQEKDFETHSKKWELYATQRYAVQLQNKNSSAITGQKVHLLNRENGDTLWTAVSDNTGKAELWQGFAGKQKEQDLELKVEGQLSAQPAIPFSQGMNRILIQQDCTVSNKVEIAFVVDATGSMQDEIDYLKEELEDILLKVTKKDPSLDMYTGAVFYRDKGDDYVTVQSDMKKGVADAINFIKKQNAGGGGDYPEALNNGLSDAINKLKWSRDARTRIIFLLMDAPPHDEAKEEMGQLIRQAAALGIRIVPLACSGTDKATEFIMRSIALATNGTYLFLTDDSGIGEAHIKPTTDEFKVELLNNLMQRTIEQMCFTNNCTLVTKGTEPLSPFSNPATVVVFPNPTKGLVTLKTDKKIKEVFIADFAGKILVRKLVNNDKLAYNIDLSGFPSATYFIKYITSDNKTGAEKVILIQ